MKKTIARYNILEEVSHGATTTVYKAYQPALDRVVLLKVLHENLVHEPDIVARFQREAKACARIKHENIVDIFDYGADVGYHYIAMEYVEGLSLQQLLEKVEHLPTEVVLFITVEILKGLAFTHSKGIYHRDIKPGNILLSYQGEVKITDFGLALISDSNAVTLQNTILGTPAYMSPEQISGDRLDGRSDIFSLGATLYEMLTKRQAFAGKSYSESLNNVLNKEPIKLERLIPDLDADLIAIVAKMLAKKTSRRFQSCEQARDELIAFSRKTGLNLFKKNLIAFIKDPKSYTRTENKPKLQPLISDKKINIFKISVAILILSMIGVFYVINNFSSNKKRQVNSSIVLNDTLALSKTGIQESIDTKPMNTAESHQTAQPAMDSTVNPNVIEAILPAKNKIESGRESRTVEKKSLPPEQGTLIIRCAPWAKVFIDKQYQKTLYELDSLKTFIAPGQHEITVVNSEFAPYDTGRTIVQIKPGSKTRLKIPFVETVAVGFLKLIVNPWAEVYVDGIHKGTTPLDPIIVKQGKHLLTLKHPQATDWETEFMIKTGETLKIAIDLM